MEVKKRLTSSFQMKWRWKSIWQHQFKRNGVVNSADSINLNKLMLETAPTTSIQTKWSCKLRWQHQFKWNGVVNSADNINSNEMDLSKRLITPIQMKWTCQSVWKYRFKLYGGGKVFLGVQTLFCSTWRGIDFVWCVFQYLFVSITESSNVFFSTIRNTTTYICFYDSRG